MASHAGQQVLTSVSLRDGTTRRSASIGDSRYQPTRADHRRSVLAHRTRHAPCCSASTDIGFHSKAPEQHTIACTQECSRDIAASTITAPLISATLLWGASASGAVAEVADSVDAAVDAGPAVAAAATAATLSQPIELTWEIWFGFFAGLSPFVIAAWEFGKRIVIQRRCKMCQGTGLIVKGKYNRKYKCTACGGFLPWESWERFFESSPGNGGVVQAPKGQSSVIYSVDGAVKASQSMAASSKTSADVEPALGSTVNSEESSVNVEEP